MARTKDETIRQVTETYIANVLTGVTAFVSPEQVQADVLDNVKNAFDIENAIKPKGEKWKAPDRLLPVQVASFMAAFHPIALIYTADADSNNDSMILGLYQEDGENKGIYVTDELVIQNLVRRYLYSMTEREFDETVFALREKATRVNICREPNLVAVNNGIFDYDTKKLMDFSPDYVFIAKSHVNYNANAKNIVIHNDEDGTDWDVESWMFTLSPSKQVVQLLWEVLGAIVRPNVPWGKSVWFYSEKGNNGKGTLCELMRQLCGKGSYASIPLADMSKDFMLEPLIRATAIIVDENDVGTFIDKAANLKAIITGDAISINRKFKQPITYQFHGLVVQCLNEMPRIKDKSDSFYRRQLFVLFENCFTGVERKYIKNDYLHRQEVLEYVLYKVLNMNYHELSEPDECKNALAEYKEFNDPVRQFVDEIFPELQWDLVPFNFLYDLYVAWYKKNFGNRDVMSNQSFTKNIMNLLPECPGWSCDDKRKSRKTGTKMDKPEPLINEYGLTNWMNPMYAGSKDLDKKCCPVTKPNYRGIVRA